MPDQINQVEISTIVCTYGRAEKIFSTFDSLASQTFPASGFEIIIVDNHDYPNADVQKVYGWFLEHAKLLDTDHLKYIHQPIMGLSHARNAGIANFAGEFLVSSMTMQLLLLTGWKQSCGVPSFLSIPKSSNWGTYHLNLPEPGPKALNPVLRNIWSHFITGYADYTEVDKWDEFSLGCKLVCAAGSYFKIGGFSLNYGRQGKFRGGEELVAASLIHSLGYKIAILPQAVVTHKEEPGRYNFMHIWRTILADTLVHYQAHKDFNIPMESFRQRASKPFKKRKISPCY